MAKPIQFVTRTDIMLIFSSRTFNKNANKVTKFQKTSHSVNAYLTHISLSSLYVTSANSVEPDQTPQNAASGQVLHGLPTECTLNI